mgnify:CR=1 FL=1
MEQNQNQIKNTSHTKLLQKENLKLKLYCTTWIKKYVCPKLINYFAEIMEKKINQLDHVAQNDK